jgi:hypothetical protein
MNTTITTSNKGTGVAIKVTTCRRALGPVIRVLRELRATCPDPREVSPIVWTEDEATRQMRFNVSGVFAFKAAEAKVRDSITEKIIAILSVEQGKANADAVRREREFAERQRRREVRELEREFQPAGRATVWDVVADAIVPPQGNRKPVRKPQEPVVHEEFPALPSVRATPASD